MTPATVSTNTNKVIHIWAPQTVPLFFLKIASLFMYSSIVKYTQSKNIRNREVLYYFPGKE